MAAISQTTLTPERGSSSAKRGSRAPYSPCSNNSSR